MRCASWWMICWAYQSSPREPLTTIALHKNAPTTPEIRADIASRPDSAACHARRFCITDATVGTARQVCVVPVFASVRAVDLSERFVPATADTLCGGQRQLSLRTADDRARSSRLRLVAVTQFLRLSPFALPQHVVHRAGSQTTARPPGPVAQQGRESRNSGRAAHAVGELVLLTRCWHPAGGLIADFPVDVIGRLLGAKRERYRRLA